LNIDDSTDDQVFRADDLNNFGVMAGNLDGWPTIGWLENGSLQTVTLDSSLRFFGAEVEALNDFSYDDSRLTVVGSTRADENGDFAAPDRGYAWRPFDLTNPTTLIGTFGGENSDSWAFDVNDSGQIVGMAEAKKGGQQPFLFADGKMTNLNSMADTGKKTLPWVNAINNQGDITGLMKIPRPISEIHGYLLRAKDQ
jgi:probable HAF family extracellular repeat protein